MVCLHPYPLMIAVWPKGLISLNGIICIWKFLKARVSQPWVLVNIDCHILVSLFGGVPVIWIINPGIGYTSWLTDTMFPGTSSVCVSLQFLRLFFLRCFRVVLENIHTVHVDVGVFDRFPGIILCCDILISFLKEICINFWWYRSNLEAAIVGCLSSSSSVTIGGCLSYLVEKFLLNVAVVGEYRGRRASSSACVRPISRPVSRDHRVFHGLLGVGTFLSWSSSSSLITFDYVINGTCVVWCFSTNSNAWNFW